MFKKFKLQAEDITVATLRSDNLQYTKALAVTADGKLLVAGGLGIINKWDVDTQTLLKSWKTKQKVTFCLEILPRNRVVSGSETGLLQIWDAETGKELESIKGGRYTRAIHALPNDKFAFGDLDGFVTIAEEKPDGGYNTYTTGYHDDSIDAIASNSDGIIFTASSDGTVFMYDYIRDKLLGNLYTEIIVMSCLAMNDDGDLVSGSDNGDITIWDVTRKTPKLQWRADKTIIQKLCILPHGHIACISNYGQRLSIWQPYPPEPRFARKAKPQSSPKVVKEITSVFNMTCITMLDNNRLVIGATEGVVNIIDVSFLAPREDQ